MTGRLRGFGIGVRTLILGAPKRRSPPSRSDPAPTPMAPPGSGVARSEPTGVSAPSPPPVMLDCSSLTGDHGAVAYVAFHELNSWENPLLGHAGEPFGPALARIRERWPGPALEVHIQSSQGVPT